MRMPFERFKLTIPLFLGFDSGHSEQQHSQPSWTSQVWYQNLEPIYIDFRFFIFPSHSCYWNHIKNINAFKSLLKISTPRCYSLSVLLAGSNKLRTLADVSPATALPCITTLQVTLNNVPWIPSLQNILIFYQLQRTLFQRKYLCAVLI